MGETVTHPLRLDLPTDRDVWQPSTGALAGPWIRSGVTEGGGKSGVTKEKLGPGLRRDDGGAGPQAPG